MEENITAIPVGKDGGILADVAETGCSEKLPNGIHIGHDYNRSETEENICESGGDKETDHWRVKVYYLDGNGTWVDIGTGFATCRQVMSEFLPICILLVCARIMPRINEQLHVYSQATDGSYILVNDETDEGKILHKSMILCSDCYERQGESIIMWKEINEETEKEYDVALSFQNPAGCLSAWNLIGTLSQPTYVYQYGQHAMRVLSGEDNEIFGIGTANDEPTSGYQKRSGGVLSGEFPACTVANILEIREIVKHASCSYNDSYVATLLDKDGEYLKNLLKIFADLEDLEDLEGLHVVADIMRSILLFNDSALLDFILEEGIFVQVLGVMEYDQNLREQANYREFITSKCRLVEIFPLTGEVKEQIQRHFHVKFLKDIVIRPLLDEGGVSSINSVLTFTAINICENLYCDERYIASILDKILSGGELINSEDRKGCVNVTCNDSKGSSNHVGWSGNQQNSVEFDMHCNEEKEEEHARKSYQSLVFLRELFFLSRFMPFDKRYEIFQAFFEHSKNKFFSAIHVALLTPTVSELPDIATPAVYGTCVRTKRSLAVEILSIIISVCPGIVRSIILEGPTPLPPANSVSQGCNYSTNGSKSEVSMSAKSLETNSKCLLFVIICLIGAGNDVSEIDLLADLLKCLLDGERSEKDKFLQLFYDFYVQWLLVPFSATYNTGHVDASNISSVKAKALEDELVPEWVGESQNSFAMITSKRCICEILCLCVHSHSYRMKYFVMRNNVIGRVFSVIETGCHQLYLGAIKFMRAILGVKDDFYYRHISKFDYMRGLFDMLDNSKGKDNIIVSSILDIIEFIRTENIRILVEYIVDKYSARLQLLDHIESFEKLLIRYDQIKDGRTDLVGEISNGASDSVFSGIDALKSSNPLVQIRNKRMADRDSEDDYFNFDEEDQGVKYSNESMRVEEGSSQNGHVLDSTRPLAAMPSSVSSSNPLSVLSSIYGDDDSDVDSTDIMKKASSSEGANSTSPAISTLKKPKLETFDTFPDMLPPLVSKDEGDDDEKNFLSSCAKNSLSKKKSVMGIQIKIGKPMFE